MILLVFLFNQLNAFNITQQKANYEKLIQDTKELFNDFWELDILEMQESMDRSPALGLILVLGHYFWSVTLLNFKNSLT